MPDAPRTLVAGVDSSTQSTKVVVCDAGSGEVVRTGRAPHPDGTEVHPDRWWEAFGAATAAGCSMTSPRSRSAASSTACAPSTSPASWSGMRCCGTTPGRPRRLATSLTSWGPRPGSSAPARCRCRASLSPRSAGWPSTSRKCCPPGSGGPSPRLADRPDPQAGQRVRASRDRPR